MQLATRFIDETIGGDGCLKDLNLVYQENYNFGYDVVDEMAALAPDQKAMIWCNPKGEHREFTI